MSYGCGSLARSEDTEQRRWPGFATGTKLAASGNGRQHTIPAKPMHKHIRMAEIEAHWDAALASQASPTRLWGTATRTNYGGEARADGDATAWLSGEYWNVDSNIRKWGEHEIKRNAAAGAYDMHRNDQLRRLTLQPTGGRAEKRQKAPRLCVSGVVSPDCSFLEAWGFDLGLRDRQAKPVGLWKPVSRGEQFRGERSFSRDVPRMAEAARSLRRSASTSALESLSTTLRPEDIGGEAGELGGAESKVVELAGRSHDARSCRGWDGYDHTCRREAARMNHGVHSPSLTDHPEDYPFVDQFDLRPAAVYSRKYQQGGHDAVRKHEARSRRSA